MMRIPTGLRYGLLIVAIVGQVGCSGWYLRGKGSVHIPIKHLCIDNQASDYGNYLYNYFVAQLSYSGIAVVQSRTQCEAVFELRNEKYTKRVLSVDPTTGKVQEIEVGLQIQVAVRTPTGELLLAPDVVDWSQDYVFDQSSVLGTDEVEQTTRLRLAENAARALLFRLELVDFKKLDKHAD